MKLKYYLRGLGIGIIVTTLILMISFSQRKESISDEEIIERATALGMVMSEEKSLLDDSESSEETEQSEDDAKTKGDGQSENGTKPEDDAQSRGEAESENPPLEGSGQPEDATADAGQTTVDGSKKTAEAGDDTTANPEDVYRLTIKKGQVCRNVCDDLASNGIIEDSEAFRKYLFEIGYANNMSTGDYDIPYGLSMEEVAQVLQRGPIEEENE